MQRVTAYRVSPELGKLTANAEEYDIVAEAEAITAEAAALVAA